MSKIFKRNCNTCKKSYVGYGSMFCSRICRRHSGLTKSKMRKLHKGGWHHSEEAKKKIRLFQTGSIGSLKTKEKMGLCKMGKKNPAFGKKVPIGRRKKISSALRGSNAPNWKGGLTAKNAIVRGSLKYRLWREDVFTRDNWTCIICGERGGILHADHIKSFAVFIKLRFTVNNGRTLCLNCHKETDTYLNRKK